MHSTLQGYRVQTRVPGALLLKTRRNPDVYLSTLWWLLKSLDHSLVVSLYCHLLEGPWRWDLIVLYGPHSKISPLKDHEYGGEIIHQIQLEIECDDLCL